MSEMIRKLSTNLVEERQENVDYGHGDMCEAAYVTTAKDGREYERYGCTRVAGHTGKHQAGITETVAVASWEDLEETDPYGDPLDVHDYVGPNGEQSFARMMVGDEFLWADSATMVKVDAVVNFPKVCEHVSTSQGVGTVTYHTIKGGRRGSTLTKKVTASMRWKPCKRPDDDFFRELGL